MNTFKNKHMKILTLFMAFALVMGCFIVTRPYYVYASEKNETPYTNTTITIDASELGAVRCTGIKMTSYSGGYDYNSCLDFSVCGDFGPTQYATQIVTNPTLTIKSGDKVICSDKFGNGTQKEYEDILKLKGVTGQVTLTWSSGTGTYDIYNKCGNCNNGKGHVYTAYFMPSGFTVITYFRAPKFTSNLPINN